MRKWNSVPPESVRFCELTATRPSRRAAASTACGETLDGDVEHHFVGNEPGLAARRDAGEAGLARKRPVRKPVARRSRPEIRHCERRPGNRRCEGLPGRCGRCEIRRLRGATRQAGGIAGEPGFTALGLFGRPGMALLLLTRSAAPQPRPADRPVHARGDAAVRLHGRAGVAPVRPCRAKPGSHCARNWARTGFAAAGRTGPGAGALRRSNACPSPAMLRQKKTADASRPRFAASRLRVKSIDAL